MQIMVSLARELLTSILVRLFHQLAHRILPREGALQIGSPQFCTQRGEALVRFS